MSLDCVQVNAEAKKGGWNVLADADAAGYTYTLVFICCSPHHFSWALSCREQWKKVC